MTELVTAALWLTAVVVALWRWPGVALGLGGSLALWTAAPWASWVALAGVAVSAAGWYWFRPRPVVWPAMGWLVRRPWLAVVVVSAGTAALAPSPVAPVSFVVLMVSAAGLARSWSRTETGTAGTGLAVPVVSGPPCPDCGGLLAVSTTRATCADCGLRFVAVSDAVRPGSGLTWFQVPAG